jgi:hypothetical protein
VEEPNGSARPEERAGRAHVDRDVDEVNLVPLTGVFSVATKAQIRTRISVFFA